MVPTAATLSCVIFYFPNAQELFVVVFYPPPPPHVLLLTNAGICGVPLSTIIHNNRDYTFLYC